MMLNISQALVILYPVLIFTFFQWTLRDSWLAVLLSVILFLCTAAAVFYPTVQTLLIARRDSSQTLYTTPAHLRMLGALYITFRQPCFHTFLPLLAAAVVKSIFIAFAKASGITQVIVLLLIELAVFVLLCVQKPHRTRGGDALGIYLAVTRVATAALMIAFVESLQVKAIPRVAVGFVIMVVFSAAIIVMCINVVLNFGNGLVWRRDGNSSGSPLRSSGGSSTDVEKGTPASDVPTPSGLRPTNPTPSTSFSQDVSAHSRHTPHMSAAVSPNFTIPSFYTSEDDGGVEETPRRSERSHSRRSSWFTATSPPSTSREEQFSSQFPSPPEHRPQLQPQPDVARPSDA